MDPKDNDKIIHVEDCGMIPQEIELKQILLPNKWTFYLYDKLLFKKIASKSNYVHKPHKQICQISTLNDLMYIFYLMKIKSESKIGIPTIEKLNLDQNDYIIMRDGIEPIWEDPKNSNGGTFTIKMDHSKGYDVWETFVMYMLGEKMSYDMANINGITVSYISDSGANQTGTGATSTSTSTSTSIGTNCNTYLKIWDGKTNRTKDQFIGVLPQDLYSKIKSESLRYSQNNKKKDFNEKNIINKLNNGKDRGGFSGYRKKY